MKGMRKAANVSRCNGETRVDVGCSSFGKHDRPEDDCSYMTFEDVSAFLCFCAVLRCLRFRDDVTRDPRAERASSDSCAVSGRPFAADETTWGTASGRPRRSRVSSIGRKLTAVSLLRMRFSAFISRIIKSMRIEALQTFCG